MNSVCGVGVLGLVAQARRRRRTATTNEPADHRRWPASRRRARRAACRTAAGARSRPGAAQGSTRPEIDHRAAPYPLSTEMSSASAPGRRRETATMMAEARPRPRRPPPPARRTRSPDRRCRSSMRPKVTNVRFTALSMSSTHMIITSGLRRTSRPTAPMVKRTAPSTRYQTARARLRDQRAPRARASSSRGSSSCRMDSGSGMGSYESGPPGQHDGADHGDGEQAGGDLEGEDVGGEELRPSWSMLRQLGRRAPR